MKHLILVLALVALFSGAATAQVCILDEPLQTGISSPNGTLVGGSFTGSAYRIDAKQDAIYWHLPHVVRNGYMQMTVTGMDGLPAGYSKYEILHAYNSVADTSGYDSLDYKMYLRKENTDKIRTCLALPGSVFNDAVSSVNPGWGGTHTLKFQWASAAGSLTINTYWDGVLQETKTINSPGYIWDPPIMSVRIGASSRGSTTGAISGATYSNFQVWDNDMTPIADDAQIVSNTLPTGMIAGQNYAATVTVKNAGSGTWTSAAGYQLGAIGDSDPFTASTRIALAGGDSIATNQQKTFSFTMTAPATAGTYTTDWQMIHNSTWFGPTLARQVNVTYADSAQFISDTIPATMTGGQQYNVSVTMKNTSQNTWTQALEYKLGANDDSDPLGPGRVELGASDSIGPNQQKTFDFAMTAPTIPGTYTTDWRMVHEGVNWFGDVGARQVLVEAPPVDPGLVLQDDLQAGTSGWREGGQFANGGWTPTGEYDCVYWHLPYTVSKGAVEFYVKGLNPRESRTTPWNMKDKGELFHMYDYTYGNADTVYDGYRNNPYKMFLRHNGANNDYNATTDAMETVWAIRNNYFEVDTPVLSWDPAHNYKFRIEWWYSDSHSNLKISRDGVQILNQGIAGDYTPAGHAVRIGASTRRAGEGVPKDAVFSYLKVYDLSEAVVPSAPEVVQPGKTLTVSTLTPVIKWKGDLHSAYQIRINTNNDPNISTVWDSGQVVSRAFEATTGTLADQTTYYAFVRVGTGQGWSAWSPTGFSFRVDTSYVTPRRGPVRVVGTCLEDDGGKFLALGFSHMKAMHRCKYDRQRYQADLSDMASQGFNYQRVLTTLGWTDHDMEVTAIDFTNASGELVFGWPDYDQQLRDTIDIAYDVYGIRTELTIFAANEVSPTSASQYQQMDRILAAVAGREQKVILIEVANEYYANGPGDLNLVRSYGAYLGARTSVPVSLSDPGDRSDAGVQAMYSGSAADVATIHINRDSSDYGWAHIADNWRLAAIPNVPPFSNNEPMGPGSSVAEETDPTRLCSDAFFGFIAHAPMYVYHCKAGIQGYDRYTGAELWFRNSPGFSVYKQLMQIMPRDVPGWTRNDGLEASAPFTVFLNGVANTYGPGAGSGSGCYRNIGATNPSNPDEWVCYPMGVQSGGVTLQARKPMAFTVYNAVTGAIVIGPISKNTNETITLSGTATAYLIKSSSDPWAPGSVTNLNASRTGTTVNLSWTNPGDADFVGTVIRYRTDTFPTGPTDGSLLCNRTASVGSNDAFAQIGVSPTGTYYYAAYAYDEVPNYSSATVTCVGCLPPSTWVNEPFDNYNDANLGGQGSWVTVGATSSQVESAFAKGGAGKAALLNPVPSGLSIANQISFSDKTSGYFLVDFDIAQDATGTAAQVIGYINIYGNSATPIAIIHIQKSRMFAEYSAGPGSLAVLSTAIANQTWYNIRIGINVDTRKLDLWLDGAPKGTNYGWKGDATNVSRVIISSDRNTNLNPQKIYVDNLRVEPNPGQPASVTDDGTWSPSLSKLHFIFDSVAGTASYQYAIGTAAGGTQIRGWTNCGTSTDVTATGLTLAESVNYYVSVQCLTQFGTAGTYRAGNGIKVAPGVATINAAKALADGTSAASKSLRGKLVSAAFPGYFYIQEPNGPFGLKVVSSASVAAGDQVDVSGYMQGSALERYMESTGSGVIKTAGPGGPDPLVLRSSFVGGMDLNANTHGIVGGIGPHSVGLYCTVCGKVTQRQTTAPMYFYIDDGSGVKDGTTTAGVENIGVRVSTDPASYPAGSYVSVRGVISAFNSSGIRAQLLPVQITQLQ